MTLSKKVFMAMIAVFLMIRMIPVSVAAEMDDDMTNIRLNYEVDYSDLELQLAMANGLRSYEYTKQSWAPLKNAMETGDRYLKGRYGQPAVNESVTAIEEAMAGLVRMDYSQLEAALGAVYQKIDENPELHGVWVKLNTAVEEARPLLSSGDQAAVNNAVVKLNELLEELENCTVEVLREPEIVVQEVEVEVLPTDDFCNISTHHMWPLMFLGSGVMNAVLVIVLTCVLVKKRNTMDNTPLVSYDIDDDIDY